MLLQLGPLPAHVAFIMDGNRRFAERYHQDRSSGHAIGSQKVSGRACNLQKHCTGAKCHCIADQLLEVLEWCLDLGIACVSVYAFSVDNFKRGAEEVETIMQLIDAKLQQFLEVQAV